MLCRWTLAGLWEGPAGRMGLEKSASPLVQELVLEGLGSTGADARALREERATAVLPPVVQAAALVPATACLRSRSSERRGAGHTVSACHRRARIDRGANVAGAAL